MSDSAAAEPADFIGLLKRAAEAIKATAEAIQAVEHTLSIFERSATLEIRNTTGRKLLLFDHVHDHGGFSPGPEPVIEANHSAVLGTRSSGFATGTEGSARYNVDGTNIFFRIDWTIPFFGSNEAGASLEGESSDRLVIHAIGANGNTNVPLKFLIGEKAALGPSQRDWRMCDKCKCLYFAPGTEKSDCPAGGRHSHTPTGRNFRLPQGVPGISFQAKWHRCVRCEGLHFNGIPNQKGKCPAPAKPIHSQDGTFVLTHTGVESLPSDETTEAGWRFCIDCFGLYSEPTNEEGCPANNNRPHTRFPDPGGLQLPFDHPLAGIADKRAFNYRLQHGVLTDSSDHSIGWRRCRKCSVLFFEPEIENSNCSLGDLHEPAKGGSIFQISTVEPSQGEFLRGWTKCGRCRGLFFPIRSVDRGGQCPQPNRPDFRLGHKPSSLEFHLPHDIDGPGQSGWRFCQKCFGLVFEPELSDAIPCPAGGPHEPRDVEGVSFRLSS